MPKTRISDYIPNFDKLYNIVKDFISTHQGKKGYIDTQNADCKCDDIYSIISNDVIEEESICGVRVKDNNIQIASEPITQSYQVVYMEEDFRNDKNWKNIKGTDVFFIPTLIAIAESIEQYVEM